MLQVISHLTGYSKHPGIYFAVHPLKELIDDVECLKKIMYYDLCNVFGNKQSC